MSKRDYNEIVESLNAKRKVRTLLNEQTEQQSTDSVPYTQQDELYTSIITTTKAQFGADYSDNKTPMLYHPAANGTGEDITLTGKIAQLNGATFQFRFAESSGEGCFIWIEPLQLTEDNIRLLQKIHGVYKNWKADLSKAEDKRPMSMANK